MTKFNRGDRVRVNTTRYGMSQYNTFGTVAAIRQPGEIYIVDFKDSPKKAPNMFNCYSADDLSLLASPSVTSEPAPKGLFMVSLLDMKTDELRPSKKPRIHHTLEAAEKEAARLAKRYGGTFIVLQLISGAHHPDPVIPPVTTFKF